MVDKLTQEMIAEAMARAEKAACRPGNDCCFPLPYGVESAVSTCSPQGSCTIGGTRRVIVASSGRESWDVWLDLHTAGE